MMADRDFELMTAALAELAKLKRAAEHSRHFLGLLYDSALQEWAERLGMDPLQLNQIVPER
ncbi:MULTISPECIES: hypothetical protein [Microvirga]|uniref:hypothetical protein n=1 Tax=Microvirga TaxID=186650 RepID=UPI000E0D47AE|nr:MULTISPECIES: hypothetical protein [Microvirga]MBQ0819198.1 hypothetical protein [Microvirga sp. HBU67558]